MNKLVAIVFFLLLFKGAASQDNFRNGIFLEAGGSGYYGSINYERKSAKGTVARVGFFIIPKGLIVSPLTFGKVLGHKNHHIELLAGFTFGRRGNELYNNIPSNRRFVYLTSFIGYRYERPNSKLFLRAGFTPLWELYDSFSSYNPGQIYPWGGVSCGFRF